MIRRMDFYELEAYVALANALHFARAAAAVHTSPSGLSRLLGRLEEELGVKLAERDTRRVELTEEGRAFLSFAEESLRRRDELRLGLGTRDGRLRGFLRVYASVTACYSVLPPFAEALASEHPDLSLSVETGDPAGADDAARSGRVELAVAAIPDGGFSDLDSYAVKRSPLVLVASLGGPWGRLDLERSESGSPEPVLAVDAPERERKLSRALSRAPLLLPKAGLARERFDRWSRARGQRPRIAAETGGNEALLAFCRLGLGLALVPRIVVESGPFADGLAIYDGAPAFGDYDIGYVMRPTKTGSESSRRVRASMAALLERAYPSGAWRTR